MLLGNQLFSNNRKGLGFGKTQVDDSAKGKSVFSRCVKCGIIGHSAENCRHRNKNAKFIQGWVPKNFSNKFHVYWNKNERTKKVWVPKGTMVNTNGVRCKQIWVRKDSNANRSGSTTCGTPQMPIEI